jgi:ABC-type polysaccharide/polyol phosphate export permease
VHRYWYPLAALVRRDLKKRYAATILGVGWTLAQPLALMAVYAVVFGFILRTGGPNDDPSAFVFFMLTGMLPYLATADGIQRAATSLREDRALLDRADFPAAVIPAAKVVGAAVAEVAGLLVVIAGLAASGHAVSPWLPVLPVFVALRILLTCGVVWVISLLAVFVTDLVEVLSLLLTAWLFLTPIFYEPSAVPDGLRWMLVMNPLHHLVEAYRGALIQTHPAAAAVVGATLWSVAFGLGGGWFFRKALDRAKDFL